VEEDEVEFLDEYDRKKRDAEKRKEAEIKKVLS
jgi:hypothetical protein